MHHPCANMTDVTRTDLRILYLTIVWLCIFGNGLLWSLPNKIIVLTSDHFQEYENAREGFVCSFDKGIEIVQLNLQGRIDADEQLAFSHALSREKPDLVLCIGSPAAQFLSLSKINVPLVHTLVYEFRHRDGEFSNDSYLYAIEYELEPHTQFALIRKTFPDIERISCLLRLLLIGLTDNRGFFATPQENIGKVWCSF